MTLLAVATILYFRLTPFDFAWEGRAALARVSWGPLSLRDVPLNVLLFVPLGFGLGGVLAARAATTDYRPQTTNNGRPSSVVRGPWSAPGLRVLLICLALSAALEATQLFLPEHVPSAADVIANGVGAMVGYGLYRAWDMGFGAAVQRYATARNLWLGLNIYALSAALLTGYLYRSARLSNWDTSFPLVVGNEAVGRREWSGRIEWLSFTWPVDDSYAVSGEYQFTGEAPFELQARPEVTLPPLVWREGPATEQGGQEVVIGPGEWLATEAAFSPFSGGARQENEFSIEFKAASADPTQRGPARIISLSADAERRNVTIGQERDALIIRLRTPAGGENGQKPELLVPGVFADGRQRQILVEYNAPQMWVTVDGQEYALSLAPGAAFFSGFITENRWQIVMDGNPRRYDWAYVGLVVGLGVVVFGGLAVAKKKLATDNTD